MRCCALILTLLATPAMAAPRPTPLSPLEADRFLRRVAAREARFLRPGVGYDARTGLTYDGHPIDPRTGALGGGPRNWSAASKESVHVALLIKAVEGDPTARQLVGGTRRALQVLDRKIESYRAFDRAHPGFGGFLPWFKVDGGRMEPTWDWQDRVPGLDNGQLAWSVYYAARTLRKLGHGALAAKYERQLRTMEKNVVRMFYDADAKKLRAETKLLEPSGVGPRGQRYANNQNDYFLDDAYEGLLLCHFADLFGDWRRDPAGRESIWQQPRRKPATFTTKGGGRLTVVQGYWFSAHEDWAFLVLPFRDYDLARDLFANAQKVRTIDAAQRGLPGLKASTHRPREDGKPPSYASALGVQQVAKQKVAHANILAPYATFPLALVDKQAYASWLRSTLSVPRVWGPCGMGESFRASTGPTYKIAPMLTWDGKMLPMLASMGGIGDELRGYLRKDGVYDRFLGRVKSDYRLFEGKRIEGRDLPLAMPPAPTLRGLSDSFH